MSYCLVDQVVMEDHELEEFLKAILIINNEIKYIKPVHSKNHWKVIILGNSVVYHAIVNTQIPSLIKVFFVLILFFTYLEFFM